MNREREKRGQILDALKTIIHYGREPIFIFEATGTILGENDHFKKLPKKTKQGLLNKNGMVKNSIIESLKNGIKSIQLEDDGGLTFLHTITFCNFLKDNSLALGLISRGSKNCINESKMDRKEMFRLITHELKSPLSNIMITLEFILLKKNKIDFDEIVNKIRSILKQVISLNSFIDNYLDMEKLNGGFIEPCIDVFDLKEMIKEIQNTVEPLVKSKGLDFIISAKNIPAKMKNDEEMIKRIILNFLNNATKFTKEGFVKLEVSKGKNTIQFTVEDSGAGIEEKNLKDIFEPFKRFKEEGKKSEGFGLGLNIANKFAKMLKGKITIKSKVGKGSKFSLVLPLR
jgi:signal transduction histidine kinase